MKINKAAAVGNSCVFQRFTWVCQVKGYFREPWRYHRLSFEG